MISLVTAALQMAAAHLAGEFGKLPGVLKVTLVGLLAAATEGQSHTSLELEVTLSPAAPVPLNSAEIRAAALDLMRAKDGLVVAPDQVSIDFIRTTRRHLGRLAGQSDHLQPFPAYRFDPKGPRRVLFRDQPKKKPPLKAKKNPSFDPQWAEAKKLCRLNTEEIRMAKELGFKPKSLLKNIPSPKQGWKAPVRIWIRDLYEERHPGKGYPPVPVEPLTPPTEDEMRAFEEEMYWEDYRERNAPPPAKSKAAKRRPSDKGASLQ